MKSSTKTFSVYAPLSRNQECCLFPRPTPDTVWRIDHFDPNERLVLRGEPIPLQIPVVIEHCATSEFLAADTLDVCNNFGIECEVSVHSYSTFNKSQQLKLEKSGKRKREVPTKFQDDKNIWAIVTSNDPSTDYKVVEVGKTTYEDLIRMIKQKMLERGIYGVRRLSRIFKDMDQKGDHKLDPDDFRWGLLDYGIVISKEDTQLFLDVCDKNRDGFIDFTEFLRFLRVT